MFTLNKIDWNKILEPEEFIFKSKSREVKVERIKEAYRNLFHTKPNLEIDEKIDVEFLFFKSMKRTDYDTLFNEIIGTCQSNKTKTIDIEYINRKRKFFYIIILFFKYFFIYRNAIRLNFYNTFFLMIKITSYIEIYDKLKDAKFSNLIVFADMQPIDNMLVQIANKNTIPTVTLQHGLYVDYKEKLNVNIVNYKNNVADYFLAWGKDTEKLIEKYHKDRKVFICGKPIKSLDKPTKEYFTVVFDQNIFHEYNKKLLEISYAISKKFNILVNLRLHPNNRLEWFKINEELTLFDKELDYSKFVVGHTTSILYELMRLGIPAYKFKSDIASNQLDEEFKFSTVEELELKINHHKKIKFNFGSYSKKYIKYIDKESLNKYKDFFKRLENGEL